MPSARYVGTRYTALGAARYVSQAKREKIIKPAFLFILGIDIFIKMVYNMQVFKILVHIYADTRS